MASIRMGGGRWWLIQWVVRWGTVLTISIGICPTQSAHPYPRGRIRWAPCRWTVVSLACLFCGGWFWISATLVGGSVVRWFGGSAIAWLGKFVGGIDWRTALKANGERTNQRKRLLNILKQKRECYSRVTRLSDTRYSASVNANAKFNHFWQSWCPGCLDFNHVSQAKTHNSHLAKKSK